MAALTTPTTTTWNFYSRSGLSALGYSLLWWGLRCLLAVMLKLNFRFLFSSEAWLRRVLASPSTCQRRRFCWRFAWASFAIVGLAYGSIWIYATLIQKATLAQHPPLISELERSVKLFPLDRELRKSPGGICTVLLCTPELGLRVTEQLLKTDPNSGDIQLARAKYLSMAGRESEARQVVAHAFKLFPTSQRLRQIISDAVGPAQVPPLSNP